ncbi:MAG: tRNA epoxyqueuosine(34) reductase QueG [Actinomycetota bacterium]
MNLLERIRAEAAASGLVGVGVCAVDAFTEVRDAIRSANASGRSASLTFTYTDPDRATDVTASFPWARRLVVGAHAYLPTAGSPGPARAGTARIARFAEADHYQPLRAALGRLAALLESEGHRAEVLVDDNRLVDRAAAVRAGVGWWGKSTMVLVPGAGPWVLVGSVVTDALVATSEPMRRGCGTCTACLPACPTGALVAPGVLDARRCLARWAQAPGWVPRELRRAMGDRLYGCDDCLDACPPGRQLLRRADRQAGRVDAVEVLLSDDRRLRDVFGRFYFPRNDARYLRRNALIVLGNSGDRSLVAVVAEFAADPDPMLRGHAAWALGRLGGDEAARALAVLEDDPDPGVAAEVALALAGTLG